MKIQIKQSFACVFGKGAAIAFSLFSPYNAFAAPTITKQPGSQGVSLFSDAKFTVTATGIQPLAYQWRFNANALEGAIENPLVLTNIGKTNAGSYDVVVSDSSGSITSRVVTLTIIPFNALYFFGHSWTATTSREPNGSRCGWDPPWYYQDRGCNGPMWPEFISTNLGLSYVQNNNRAQCGALSSDQLAQVAKFQPPPKPELSTYFLWAGGVEYLRAVPPDGVFGPYINVTNETAWDGIIRTAVSNNSNAVHGLYLAGARTIVVKLQQDFTKFPLAIQAFRNNPAGLAKWREYIVRGNLALQETLATYMKSHPDLRIIIVDVFSKIDELVADPAAYGFTKTTVDALSDPALKDKSFPALAPTMFFGTHSMPLPNSTNSSPDGF
jgi:hypothetical protein